MRAETPPALVRFNEVVERLRGPDGCPWDRQQTHASLAPYLLEETYEVLDAIAEDRVADLREELGDILLQVFLHSAVAAERRGLAPDGFDLGDVADAVTAKMIHRHPHVFGDAGVDSAEQVVVNWERLKAQEKGARRSLLEGVPASLPALARAEAIQKRPARIGFDPSPTLDSALQQVRDLLGQVEAPVTEGPPAVEGGWVAAEGGFARGGATATGDPLHRADPGAEALVGDILFAVVALARRLGVNPEAALRARANDFAARFARVESGLRDEGIDVHGAQDIDWDARWRRAQQSR